MKLQWCLTLSIQLNSVCLTALIIHAVKHALILPMPRLVLQRNSARLNEVHRWFSEQRISAVYLNLPDFLAFCRHKVDEARASGASLFHTVLHLNIAALLCFSVRQSGELHCQTLRATIAQGRRPSQVTQLLQALPVSANGPPPPCSDWLRYWRIIE